MSFMDMVPSTRNFDLRQILRTLAKFLIALQGYKVILAERRGTLSEQCNKLRNGLTKLEEAREQVSKFLKCCCTLSPAEYHRA